MCLALISLVHMFPGRGDEYSATCFAQSMMLEDGVGTSTLGDFLKEKSQS
jgi:hypothetical protein